MDDDAPRRGASFSSAFSIILSLARERIAELGCPPIGEDPKAFVERGGLSRLETEASETAVRRVGRPIRLSLNCLAPSCRAASNVKLFWLALVKTWLALKRRWDIDCDHRQASAGVLTANGARRPKIEGGKPDGVVVWSLSCCPAPEIAHAQILPQASSEYAGEANVFSASSYFAEPRHQNAASRHKRTSMIP